MEKLRECPFCGGIGDDPMKYMETDTKKRYVIDCYNCGLRMWSLTEDDVVKTWNNRQEPKHETVEQWEEREGETYPDDGPVWLRLDNADPFGIMLYGERQRYLSLWTDTLIIIVATHHGKPESIGG